MENIPFIMQGKTKIYARDNALILLSEIRDRNLIIHGIDGFRVLPEGLQIEQDYSLNFSLKPFEEPKSKEEVYRLAKEFLETMPEDVYFEIVHEGDALY